MILLCYCFSEGHKDKEAVGNWTRDDEVEVVLVPRVASSSRQEQERGHPGEKRKKKKDDNVTCECLENNMITIDKYKGCKLLIDYHADAALSSSSSRCNPLAHLLKV